jgi:hypothetical protein
MFFTLNRCTLELNMLWQISEGGARWSVAARREEAIHQVRRRVGVWWPRPYPSWLLHLFAAGARCSV